MPEENGLHKILDSVIVGNHGVSIPGNNIRFKEKEPEPKKEEVIEKKTEAPEPKVKLETDEEEKKETKKVEPNEEQSLEEAKKEDEAGKEKDEIDYSELPKEVLLAELAKEAGYFEDEIDKGITADVLIETIGKTAEKKAVEKMKNLYGEDNFKVFKQFVDGKLEGKQGQSFARDIQIMDTLGRLELEGEDEDNNIKNRQYLLRYLYITEKKLNPSIVEGIISNHVKDGEDLQIAKQIQETMDIRKKNKIKEYESNENKKDREYLDNINDVLDNSKLKDIFLKTEKERTKLRKSFNDRTEEMYYTDEGGNKRKQLLTRSQRLIQEAFKDSKKILAIVSLLENINSREDIDNHLEDTKKNKILKAYKESRDENSGNKGSEKNKNQKKLSVFETWRAENRENIN